MKHIKIFSSVSEYETSKSGGTLVTPNVSLINEDNSVKYLLKNVLTHNEHEYVDLGLPSGTKWATMNVGASSETDYGNYYQYGKGAAQYTADLPYRGIEDPLDSSVDTATQVWGGSWHMPTKAQMEELVANTTYEWVTNYKNSGINGCTFTATNGAVLFFPAAGYWYNGSENTVGGCGEYWCSSPDDRNYARFLEFNNSRKGVYISNRASGMSVRPVVG